MAKSVTAFTCTACGAAHKKWAGRCDACGAWNTIIEEAPLSQGPGRGLGAAKGRSVPLSGLATHEPPPPRSQSGMAELDRVLGAVNASGYGLTFGLHTRIDDRVQHVDSRLNVGNLYVNRNQIGAIVGSQPFGGEGLSGTGPKAGGPHYVPRFRAVPITRRPAVTAPQADPVAIQKELDDALTDSATPRETVVLPGPTGESNRLTTHARGTVLCLGPDAQEQAAIAVSQGCAAVAVEGHLDANALKTLSGMAVVAYDGPEDQARHYRQALAARDGAIVPLVASAELAAYAILERHLCIDTTASGGNASLLAAAE